MKKIFITSLLLIFFLPTISLAASLSLSSGKDNIPLQEQFLVQVFLDTKDVKVNAIEGLVSFPQDLLELKENRDGNSLVNFWIEKPHSGRDGEIVFSGITPGGFSGKNIFLFAMVFQPKKIGSGVIDINNISILQSDGLGTKINTQKYPFRFSISRATAEVSSIDLDIVDTEPPEDFKLYIGNDSSILDGKYFLVFSAVDKGSGVDHFKVKESFWGFGGEYITAESPYILSDQTLKDDISVAAFDKNGNIRVVNIGAENRLGQFGQIVTFSILLVIGIFIIRKIWLKFLKY